VEIRSEMRRLVHPPHAGDKNRRIAGLSAKHRVSATFRVARRGRLRLLLAARGGGDGVVGGTIGDAFERVGDAGQLEGKLLGSSRALQDDDAFSAEVESGPEEQTHYERNENHKRVMTCDRDAAACDDDQVV
jgi:hypothetical protein